MALQQLRVGIAGTGFIGIVHARSARLAGARVVSVAASSPESAQAAALALQTDRAAASAEELVEDPELDVIHICTPNHLHQPLAAAALAAGKHVVC
jgi:predicted dehydrogenase